MSYPTLRLKIQEVLETTFLQFSVISRRSVKQFLSGIANTKREGSDDLTVGLFPEGLSNVVFAGERLS